MPSNEITKLYKGVIDDVIRNVRKDFVNMGVDEQVLYDLQMLWEQKLMDYKVVTPGEYYGNGNATGNLLIQPNLIGEQQQHLHQQQQGGLNVLASGAVASSGSAVAGGYQQNYHPEVYGYLPNGMRPPNGHGNNTYYHPTQGYFEATPAPTAANLPNFHQISQLQQQQQKLQQQQQQQQQRLQRPPQQQQQQQQQQPQQSTQQTQKDTGKSTTQQQQQPQQRPPNARYDGAGDDPVTDTTNLNDPDEIIRLLFASKQEKDKLNGTTSSTTTSGINEDTTSTGTSGTGATFNINLDLNNGRTGGVENDDDEINSDLDDDDDEDEGNVEGDGDEESGSLDENVVLCQYEKVNRTRNKWRCFFKSGIIHLNGIDYAFSKANGEFEW